MPTTRSNGDPARRIEAARGVPRRCDDWWRKRAASQLERTSGGWTIVGHAVDAGRVVYR
jgi:hypothetical protein